MNSNKYNLTFPQKNILLVDRFNQNSSINVIVGTVNINTEFDAKICEESINSVIKNNDVMRMKLSLNENIVSQNFGKFEYQEIKIIDMNKMNSNEIEEYINKKATIPFELLENKLYEFEILNYGENKGAILMRIHHIISDAWSCSKIGTELIKFIEDKISEAKPSYIEYISSEKEYEKSDKCIEDEKFWKEYLQGISAPISLKNGTDNLSTEAKRYSVKLEEKTNSNILEYCKENKISPYVLFLTALSAYIYRIKDEKDMVIGTPVLNRSNFKEKQMLGMFVSTMPLRIKVEEGKSFIDLAKEISSNTLTLFRHQKYPYSKTLEYVHQNSDIKSNLYRIVLSYQNAKTTNFNKEKYSTSWTFSSHIQDDLQIHITDMDDTGILNINYDYLTSLFSDIEISYLHTRLMAIIKDAIENINVDIEDICIMSKEEEHKILYEFNNTKVDYSKDKTIIELFEEQAEKTPNNIALVFENKQMTYKELNEKSNQISYFLRKEKAVKPNDIVALILNRSFEMIIAILGTLKAGAAYLPIDPEFPKDRIKYMLENSNAITILYDNIEKIKNIIIDKNNIFELLEKKSINTNLEKINTIEDLIYIIYTSGTTGNPKGVMITHKNVLNLLYGVISFQNLEECDIWGGFSTYAFDISILEMLVPLCLGKRLIIANESEQKMPDKMQELIINNKIEVMNITPTRMKLLLEYNNNKNLLKSLKRIMLGGEIFPVNLYDKIRNLTNAIIYDGYGPTEITVWSSAKIIKSKNDINIGKSLPNVYSYILDKKMRILPIECTGELCIAGDGVAKGYYKNNITKEKFVDWDKKTLYKTGDLVYYNNVGDMNYIARKDTQIKLHGLRIEVEEIETKIREYDEIMQSAVIVNDKNILCAYYSSNNKVNISKLKEYLSTKLPQYMLPRLYMQIEKFELTTLGKINKKKLPEIKVKQNKKIEPKNDIQKKIKKVISKILKNEDIGIDSDLFDLGIDSLIAINIALMLKKEFNVEISPKDIFENSTIESLEKVILLSDKLNKNIKEDKEIKNYPLTSSQKGIFTSYSMNPNCINYNIPFEIKFSKKVDIEKLKSSVETAIKSHKTFFTKINIIDGELYQSFCEENDFYIFPIKVSETDYKYEKSKFVRPFDLLNDRLFDVKIYSTEKNNYLLVNIHHIIFDGTSLYILLDEIKSIYNGIKLKEDKLFFGQIALLEEKRKGDKKYIESKSYFNNMFSDELPINSFPIDNERKEINSYNGETLKLNIDEETFCSIKKISKENNFTISNLFFAIFNFLLSKYMYTEDVVVGFAISGRTCKEELNSIGMFVKTIPFRKKIEYNEKILQYIKSTQLDVFEILENNSYSYEALLKDLNISKELSRNPLFDIMFVYQNDGIPNIEFENSKIEISTLNENTSKFDITCEVMPKGISADINLEYNTDLFKKDTIKRFGENYINLIKNIIKNIDLRLNDIETTREEEKNKILKGINDTKVKYDIDKTAIEIFEDQVKKVPNNLAVVCENEKLTYEELNIEANKLAYILKEKGLKSGEMVAIMMPKSVNIMISILAILKNNAIYVPIEIDYPLDRINYIINDTKARFILSNDSITKNIDAENINVNFSLKKSENIKNIKNIKVKRSINDAIYVMYTSGTTGMPKGVLVTNKNAISLIQNTNYVEFRDSDRIMQTGSSAFDATTFEYFGAIFHGLPLYLLKKENLLDLRYFEEYIKKNKITIIFLTTQLFNQIVEYNPLTFENVRIILTGGEALSIKHINIIKEKCPKLKLNNVYGPTENTTFSTYYPITNKQVRSIPIGKPISNKTCYIIDKCNKIVPIGVPGELIVGGDGVALGYLNKEKITSEKFIKDIFTGEGNLYKTGDLAKLNKEGNIEFIGRIDNQVKIRGFRVEPDEINQKLLDHPNIDESIIVVEEKETRKILVAYYTSKKDISNIEITEYLKKILPTYMIPSYFIKVDKIPLNNNGKTDKKALYKIGKNIIEASNKKINIEYTGIYLEIYNIFSEVLEKSDILYDDNFFEIGGDSLLAIKFVTRAMAKNIIITYADLFKYPSIKELGDMISKNYKKESISNIIKTYDYSKINDLLEQNKVNKYINQKSFLGNVLLTGVTGFLGAHILDSFMKKEIGKIYCIVRKKDEKSILDRIKSTLNFFFGNKYDNEFNKRIFVIEGDITNIDIVTQQEDLKNITENIDTIINSAAYVKHFGDIKVFQDINVLGVQNVVNFCLKYNKKMVHISTLSVSGNLLEAGQLEQNDVEPNTIFDEKKLYIGQNLDNEYAYTKFAGEKIMYDAIINKGLDGKIMRMGNLTGRFDDGKFQPNVDENAFANRLKTMIELGLMPDNILEFYLEFTPIDYAADAVIILSQTSNQYNTYHIFNHKHAPMKFVYEVLKEMGIKLKNISKKDMTNILDSYMKQKDGFEKIKGVVLDINKNKELDYSSNTIVKSDFTIEILKENEFEWVNIDREYIKKYIGYLFDIKFLNVEENNEL